MMIRLHIVVPVAFVSLLWPIGSTSGQTTLVVPPSREDAVVDSAAEVLNQITSIPDQSIPGSLLARAEGIAVIPGMLKGGFIVGVRHGRGVIVTRDASGTWTAPAFVQITGASVGWQAGVQGTDLVLVFCTKASLQNLLRGKFTIGANASVAAGPVGRDTQAATDARLKAEIYSYSRSRGLFAGVALDGAVLGVDNAATNAYYGTVGGTINQPGQPIALPASASRLQQQLAKYKYATTAEPVPVQGKPVPVDPQALRRRLADSSQRLAAILDASWQTFLALPAEVYSGDRPPSAEALRLSQEHFDTVVADPRYQSLAQRKEFRTTWSLLRQYSDAAQPATTQPLSLPPPPN